MFEMDTLDLFFGSFVITLVVITFGLLIGLVLVTVVPIVLAHSKLFWGLILFVIIWIIVFVMMHETGKRGK